MSKRLAWCVVVYTTGSGRQCVCRGHEGLCRRVAVQLAAKGELAFAVREGGAA